jgi:hypothetical protein
MTQKNNTTRRKKHMTVFTTDDYNSGDGMLTSVWGPGMWHYLHTMSFNYPIQPSASDKKHYRDFILSLQHILPCGKCRDNLKRNFKSLPLTTKHMKNRETFSKYVFELHEVINHMLKKGSGLSYEHVRDRYEHFRSRCVKPILLKGRQNNTKKVRFTETPAHKSENGCTEPLYGEKSKCILKIVPDTTKCDTLQIDDKCVRDNTGEP